MGCFLNLGFPQGTYHSTLGPQWPTLQLHLQPLLWELISCEMLTAVHRHTLLRLHAIPSLNQNPLLVISQPTLSLNLLKIERTDSRFPLLF